jgi:hypothetical protein
MVRKKIQVVLWFFVVFLKYQDKRAAWVWAIKQDTETLYDEVKTCFEGIDFAHPGPLVRTDRTFEVDHGRQERLKQENRTFLAFRSGNRGSGILTGVFPAFPGFPYAMPAMYPNNHRFPPPPG